MAYNTSQYWRNKNERALLAAKHTERMEREFNDEILDCIDESYIYNHCNSPFSEFNDREQTVQTLMTAAIGTIKGIVIIDELDDEKEE